MVWKCNNVGFRNRFMVYFRVYVLWFMFGVGLVEFFLILVVCVVLVIVIRRCFVWLCCVNVVR